jgi:lauroyl/myristoyl acyltransferase
MYELTPFVAVANFLPIFCFRFLVELLAAMWPRHFHGQHHQVNIQLPFCHLVKQEHAAHAHTAPVCRI